MANISYIRHIHVFSFFLPDDKSHFNIAFWSLAFRSSSEEHCWVDFPRVFWSHVIILEAQTAPWVAFFNFTEEDSSPVPTQKSATAGECVDWNSLPILFRQLKSCCSSIDVLSKILFVSAIFVTCIWWIRIILQEMKLFANYRSVTHFMTGLTEITFSTKKVVSESIERAIRKVTHLCDILQWNELNRGHPRFF